MPRPRQWQLWCGVVAAAVAALCFLSFSLNQFANKGLKVSLPTSLPTSVSFTDGQIVTQRYVKWPVPRPGGTPPFMLRVVNGRARAGPPWYPGHSYRANSNGTMASHTVNVPLWLPGIPAAMLAGWWARGLRWRWRGVVCFGCGYDLGGLPDGTPCPECGGVDSGQRRARLVRRVPRLAVAVVAGCLAATFLLAIGLNLIDHQVSHSSSDRTRYISLENGQLSIQSWSLAYMSQLYPDNLEIEGGLSLGLSRPESWHWLPRYKRLSSTGPTWNVDVGFYFEFPLWIPALAAALVTYWGGRPLARRPSSSTGGRQEQRSAK